VARDAWAEAAKIGDEVYVQDITFGPEKHLRGCWTERLPAIEQDVERMAKILAQKRTATDANHAESAVSPEKVEKLVQAVLEPPRRPALAMKHEPPAKFAAGSEVALVLKRDTKEKAVQPEAVTLHYRHVNQAEKYQTAEMKADGSNWSATIPADYTQSPYPLQYYFQLRLPKDENASQQQAALYPGLGSNLCGQPYFVIRQG
jgi:hypothetical protein